MLHIAFGPTECDYYAQSGIKQIECSNLNSKTNLKHLNLPD